MENENLYQKRQWFTITELEMAARCPRHYFYACGCGLRKPDPIPALSFGEAIHAGAPLAILGHLDKALDAFSILWEKSLISGIMETPNENLSLGQAILEDLFATCSPPRGFYTILDPPGGALDIGDHISDYEIPFAIDIGLPIPLCGRIDSFAEDKWKDKWVVDYKTTRELSERFFGNFVNNPQVIGYTTAARSLDFPAKGAIIHGLRKSKTGKTENISQPFHVSDQQVSDFLLWARHVGTMILEYEEKGYWPKWFSGCTPYASFGTIGYPCDYTLLCQAHDWKNEVQNFSISHHIPYLLQKKDEKEI